MCSSMRQTHTGASDIAQISAPPKINCYLHCHSARLINTTTLHRIQHDPELSHSSQKQQPLPLPFA